MNVLDLIAKESARLHRLAWVSVVGFPTVAALGVLAATASWLDAGRWLLLPPFIPLFSWIVVMATALVLGLRVRRAFEGRATPRAVADAMEQEHGLRRGALTGLMEVADSGVFATFASEQLGARLAGVAARPAPRLRRRLVRAAGLSGIAFAQLLVLASVSYAKRPDGWHALLHPIDAWRGALVSPLAFTDAPSRALRGAPVALAVTAPGRTRVQVRWRATGGDWQQVMVTVDSLGRAEARIPSADADLVVLASDGRQGRDSITVRVVDRPFVGDITLTASYPGYLRRAEERLPADAPIRIPIGTTLSVAGAASEPLAQVALLSAGARVTLQPEGTRFRGRFLPRQRDFWRWDVRGTSAESLDVPPPLDIEVITDSLPRVEILSPTGEVTVTPTQRVMLELLAQDDHALARVWLRLSRVGSAGAPREILLSERPEALWSGAVAAELAAFALTPGDAIQAILVARDAAPGARDAFSAPVILRVPTANQAREAARAAAEAAVNAADAAVAAQKDLAERTANEARTRTDRTEAQRAEDARAAERPSAAQPPREALGYEGAERAREIGAQQRQLTARVNQLEEASRELEDRLREAGALDSGLARQLQDAQRMLREAMTPEMAAALERLQSSTQQLDGQRTRQSMADLAAQQQRMRQTLERSAEMLRRAALEGQMQTLADQGRDLASAQRALADSAQAGRRPERDAAADAARMQRAAQDLAQGAQQLSERLAQAQAKPGADATARGAQQAGEAAEQLRSAARDPNAASDAAASLERAAESLADARGEQVAEWKAELTEALDRSVQELVQMAREQDALADQARTSENPAALRGAQSALQQGVQAAQQRLDDEGRRSTLLSPRSQELMQRAQQRSAQATRETAEGRRGQSEQAMREASDALRQAAAQLTRDRERAATARSATGMAELLQQMQQLAQQQGGLNSQLQSLLPMVQQQGARQGMDAATREQARQLARSQRAVAQQLDDVADADPTGRAQELAREARALAAALDQGAVDPATQARQERLFRRMLDAGRSLEQEQRDESQRREARAARLGDRVTPTGDGRGAPAARYTVPTWEELRGLSAEDRRLVIEYFRRLNAAGGTP